MTNTSPYCPESRDGDHKFALMEEEGLYMCEFCHMNFSPPSLTYGLIYGRLRDIDKNHTSTHDQTLVWLLANGIVVDRGLRDYYLTEAGENLKALAYESYINEMLNGDSYNPPT